MTARLGPGDGFSAAVAVAPAMLRAALKHGAPKAVFRLGALPAGIGEALDASGVPVVDTPEALQRRGLPLPRRLQHGELEFDLRRDPQAARDRLRRRLLPWRWPVLFALCAALLWSATQVLAIRDIEARTRTIEAATRALATQHFIPAGPILDIRSQVSRALSDLRGARADASPGPSPLVLFGAAADVIAARPGVVTERVSFAAPEGLVLVLRLPDFAASEAIAADLRAAGLAVEVADSRVSEAREGVRTELVIGDGVP